MDSVVMTFRPEGTKIEARPGEKILDVLSHAGHDINNQCGGEGVCGRCRAKVTHGRVNFSSRHLGILTKRELEPEQIVDQSGKFIRYDHPRVRVVDEVAAFVLAQPAETANGEAIAIAEDDIGKLIKSKGAILAARRRKDA